MSSKCRLHIQPQCSDKAVLRHPFGNSIVKLWVKASDIKLLVWYLIQKNVNLRQVYTESWDEWPWFMLWINSCLIHLKHVLRADITGGMSVQLFTKVLTLQFKLWAYGWTSDVSKRRAAHQEKYKPYGDSVFFMLRFWMFDPVCTCCWSMWRDCHGILSSKSAHCEDAMWPSMVQWRLTYSWPQ